MHGNRNKDREDHRKMGSKKAGVGTDSATTSRLHRYISGPSSGRNSANNSDSDGQPVSGRQNSNGEDQQLPIPLQSLLLHLPLPLPLQAVYAGLFLIFVYHLY